MRVVLTGGGTGGHIIPNIAVIEELKKVQGVEMLYIGSENGPERKMIEKVGIDFEAVACGKLRRYIALDNLIDMFRVPVGVIGARKILTKFKPDVVFSKGGYVSFPVMVAAHSLGMKVILHESDVEMGLANKIALKLVDTICLSFEESKKEIDEKYLDKVVVTGNPVRKSILKGEREAGLKFCGFDKHRPVILIMGGSQGAQQINELVRESVAELVKRYQIVHITGRGNLDISMHMKGYRQFEYLDEELKDLYAICELVVTRGGANSLAELGVLGKKAVVIPLGTEASRGDQIENAKVFAGDLGWSILEGEVNKEDFIEAIEMADRSDFGGRKIKNGLDEIVELILKAKS